MNEEAVKERLREKGIDPDKIGEKPEHPGTSRVEVQNVGIGFGEIEGPRGFEKAMLLQIGLAVIMDDDALDDLNNQLAAMRGKVVVARSLPQDRLAKGGLRRVE